MSPLKDCPTCGQVRDRSEFNKNRSRPDGLHGECKPCHRERERDYWRRRYYSDPEWRQKQLDYIREYKRRRRAGVAR